MIGRLAVDGPPIRRDTIFRISSMTKPMVAAVALTLVEDGTLGFDEPVDIWLPELSRPRVLRHLDGPLDDTVPAHRAITVRDVLTYRMGSGLVLAAPHTYPVQDALAALGCGVAPFTVEVPEPDTWLRRLGALPLIDQPGQTWRYDLAGDVLGVLLARATGQALPDLLQERLFEPLGMTATGFAVAPDALPRLAARYTSALVAVDDGDRTSAPVFPSGAGGLFSTLDDVVAFARMLRRGGDPVLRAESVTTMTTDQLTPSEAADGAALLDGGGWGMGMGVLPDRTYGWAGGLGTFWRTNPDRDRIAVLLTQVQLGPDAPPVVADFAHDLP